MADSELQPGDCVRYSGPAVEAVRFGVSSMINSLSPVTVQLSGGFHVKGILPDGAVHLVPSSCYTMMAAGGSSIVAGGWIAPPEARMERIGG